jgi:hypothetical protein
MYPSRRLAGPSHRTLGHLDYHIRLVRHGRAAVPRPPNAGGRFGRWCVKYQSAYRITESLGRFQGVVLGVIVHDAQDSEFLARNIMDVRAAVAFAPGKPHDRHSQAHHRAGRGTGYIYPYEVAEGASS